MSSESDEGQNFSNSSSPADDESSSESDNDSSASKHLPSSKEEKEAKSSPKLDSPNTLVDPSQISDKEKGKKKKNVQNSNTKNDKEEKDMDENNCAGASGSKSSSTKNKSKHSKIGDEGEHLDAHMQSDSDDSFVHVSTITANKTSTDSINTKSKTKNLKFNAKGKSQSDSVNDEKPGSKVKKLDLKHSSSKTSKKEKSVDGEIGGPENPEQTEKKREKKHSDTSKVEPTKEEKVKRPDDSEINDSKSSSSDSETEVKKELNSSSGDSSHDENTRKKDNMVRQSSTSSQKMAKASEVKKTNQKKRAKKPDTAEESLSFESSEDDSDASSVRDNKKKQGSMKKSKESSKPRDKQAKRDRKKEKEVSKSDRKLKETSNQINSGSGEDSDDNEEMLPIQTPSKTKTKNSNFQVDSESSSECEDAAKSKLQRKVSRSANNIDSDEVSSESEKHDKKRKSSKKSNSGITEKSAGDQRSKKEKKRKDYSPEEKTVKQKTTRELNKKGIFFSQEDEVANASSDDSSDSASSNNSPKSVKKVTETSAKKKRNNSDLKMSKKENKDKPLKAKRKEKSPKRNLSDEDLNTSSAGASARRKKKTEKSKEEKETQSANKSTRSKTSVEKEDCDKVKRTIKAKVADVHKTKDTYVLYLEDPSINKGEIEEDTMLLDGLQKLLFVTFTFEQQKYARAFRKVKHDESSNLLKVTKASAEDFDIFHNMISIHCNSLTTEKDLHRVHALIQEMSHLEIINIIQYDDPRSAVVVFSPEHCSKGKIAELSWDCSVEYKNEKIIVAPVYRNKMVIVDNLNKNTLDVTLERFLTSKRQGGQPKSVESIHRINANCAIVTFKTYEALENIIAKGSYKLEGANLDICQFYPCLKPDTFDMHLTENESEKTHHDGYKRPTNTSQSGEAIKLDYCEIKLLQQLHIFEDLQENHSVEITLEIADKERCSTFIKGSSRNTQDVKCKILEICSDTLRTEKIDLNLAPPSEELLMFEDVQEKTNQLLQAKQISAFFAGFNKAFKVCHKKDEDIKQVCQLIKSQAEIKHMELDDEMLGILQSPNGEKFLDELKKTDEKQTTSIIKVDRKQKFLLIVTRTEQMWQLVSSIEQFLDKNKIHTREVEMPYTKKAYINKFCKTEFEEILENLQKSGTDVKCVSNKIILKGLLEQLEMGVTYLENLSDSFVAEETDLSYVGINQFLSKHGAKIIKEIEEDYECIILEKNKSENERDSDYLEISTGLGSSITPIASAQMHNCKVIFLQGNPLNIKADAVISFIDRNGNCLDDPGKDILLRGGSQIQKEINEKKRAWEKIIQTSAGEIKNIREIYHLVLSSSDMDIEDLVELIVRCLKQATDNVKSLVFPTALFFKKFKLPRFAICSKIITALQNYFSVSDNRLAEILFCDENVENISEMMDRFEATFETYLEKLGNIHEEESAKAESRKNPKSARSKNCFKFGPVTLKVIGGTITKSKTDGIVTTIDKSLDLSKSKISQSVLKYGGQEIQDEINDNYSAPLDPGEFVLTAGGNLDTKHIYHVCLPRWRDRTATQLTDMLLKILKCADDKQLTTISIPALGIGGMRYPAQESGEAFVEAVKKFSRSSSNLTSITWVLYAKDQETEETFIKILNSEAEDEDDIEEPEQDRRRLTQNHKLTFGSVTLSIKTGDITQEKCDAIANSIKESMDLDSSGAVCKKILEKCGRSFQDECSENVNKMKDKGLAVTSASGLPCSKIFHLSMDRFKYDWGSGVSLVLKEAERIGIRSLALPVLGAASKNADLYKIKESLLEAIKRFGASNPQKLKDIRLVALSNRIVDLLVEKQQMQEIEDNFIQMTVISNEHGNVKKAIEKLQKQCKKKYFCHDYSFKLKNLTPEQVKKLKDTGLQHCTYVTLKADQVVVQGFPVSTDEAQKSFFNFFMNMREEANKEPPLQCKWQYENKERWRDFDENINRQIEKEFSRQSSSCIVKDEKGRSFKVDFKTMEENYMRGGTLVTPGYPIRRIDLNEDALPGSWGGMSKDENVKLVVVKPESNEFKTVAKNFTPTGRTVKQIERVQNKSLYRHYQLKKTEITKRNPPKHENEKTLFFGAQPANINIINTNGFLQNYAGPATLGLGAHFYVNPAACVQTSSADPTTGLCRMYQAKVLVGESTLGQANIRSLPLKNGQHPYDSGIDNVKSTYVIFNDAQAYPEYIISFS
ncbi:protein mono-ADP-ribosyltransferase PARP14-like [Physella acuta]|uniref:protein mono-ADP-ribosyltransferase PARP14-like n=1 Tax=Physella acuta TaxID=109671 RepID=UPI0027DC6CC9|nr:protein mono-ADP-ribosyltransferase PARP14-like [Physella acuta]XP_059146946.1 protein mono-ADP-ribosyltransferase PARP14-like [Physella acuta]XP_059146947.1 protein mono-ADP-ribosyltransferase PARP14-like [Physella acuta]XP_059146948.1 protein mono-ADP-ribosyltransferase PARP14-like [Physella acuta]XP_059146949.1 protein mono-ADP-ribosyltransferase PARP14-like [Physella acuta]